MDKIIGPRKEGDYQDRNIDCEEAMDTAIRDLVDAANSVGWTTPEVLDAIGSVLPQQRSAYAEDPDPADEVMQ